MKLTKIHIFLSLGFILLASILLISFRKTPSGITQMPITSTSTGPAPSVAPASSTQPQVTWSTYTNKAYNYTLQYADNMLLPPVAEEERLPVEQSADIQGGGFEIKVWHTYASKQDLEFPENNILAKLDLKSFAEALRKKEDVYNQTVPDKKVSELEEIIFAGYKAYTVTVSPKGNINDGSSSRVIYFDGKNNRFVVTYSLNGDLSKRVIDTFRFTK